MNMDETMMVKAFEALREKLARDMFKSMSVEVLNMGLRNVREMIEGKKHSAQEMVDHIDKVLSAHKANINRFNEHTILEVLLGPSSERQGKKEECCES